MVNRFFVQQQWRVFVVSEGFVEIIVVQVFVI